MPKPSARQTRWLHWLQEFDLTIMHIPMKSNVVADLISRMYEQQNVKTEHSPS